MIRKRPTVVIRALAMQAAIRAALCALILAFATPVAAEDFEDGMKAYRRGQIAAAFEIFRPLAEQGDARAQHKLGDMYHKGHGAPRDYKKAVKWWLEAAGQRAANILQKYAESPPAVDEAAVGRSDRDARAPEVWATDVCSNFAGSKSAAEELTNDFQTNLKSLPGDDLPLLKEMTLVLTEHSLGIFDINLRKLKSAGVPELQEGIAFSKSLVTRMEMGREKLEIAQNRLTNLPVVDANNFVKALGEIFNSLRGNFSQEHPLGARINNFLEESGVDLNRLPACKPPFGSDDGAKVIDIAVGWGHACALREGGRVWCWGGEILNGRKIASDTPILLRGLEDIRKVAAGPIASCAIDASGAAMCWGANLQSGRPPDKEPEFGPQPFPLQGLPPVKDISIGYAHICALTIDGDVYCWGLNGSGQVGDGSTAYRPDPYKVEGIEEAISLDAGILSTCAVEANGSVKCWGTDDPGDTVGGFVIESTRPKQILKLDDVVSVSNARNYFCALRRQGQLLCLGSGAAMPKTNLDPGALESLIKTSRPVFKSFLGSLSIVGGRNKIVAADLGIFHGCAVFEDGRMACWGMRDEPVIVPGIGGVKKVGVGSKVNCALLRGGYVRCWGEEVGDHEEIIFPSN